MKMTKTGEVFLSTLADVISQMNSVSRLLPDDQPAYPTELSR